MTAFTVRRATIEDAAVVSRIATETFVETFGHLYPPEDLRHFLENTYTPELQRKNLENEEKAIWLLEHEGAVVGHAFAGPCGLPHADVREEDGELKRLYVLRRFHGRGWGSVLLRTALAWLEREGPRTLWIGVWSENLGAQKLYARHGFEKVGDYEFPVGRVRDHEFILRRRPDSSTPGTPPESRTPTY